MTNTQIIRNQTDPTDPRPWQVWTADPRSSGGWRLTSTHNTREEAETAAAAAH